MEDQITATNASLIQQDQLLLAWPFSMISASILPQITSCHTSFDVWMTLEGIFNTRSKSRIIHLQNQLRNLRKDNLSVDDFFAKLTTLPEELREAGIIIDDDELSLIALNGLDESYDSFVTAQTARIGDINFSSLLGLLHSNEARLSRQSEIRGVAMANVVHSSSNVVSCQICGKKGHNALGCYNRHNEQRFPSTTDKSRNSYRFNRGGKAATPAANAVWYPDSRASEHVSGDSNYIQNTDKEKAPRSLTIVNE